MLSIIFSLKHVLASDFYEYAPDPIIQYNQTGQPYIAYGGSTSGDFNDLNVLGESLTYNIPETQDGNINTTLLYDNFENWATASDCSPGTLPTGSWSICSDTADSFIRGTTTAGEYNNGTKALTLYDWDTDNFPTTEALIWCGDTSSYTKLYLIFWWRRIALDGGEYGRIDANKTGTAFTNIFDTGNGADTNYAERQIDISNYISTYSCIGLHALMNAVAEKFLVDDLRIIGERPLYRVEGWHNSSQIADGNILSINATINFTTNESDSYSLQIYDFANSQWTSIDCDSGNVLADIPTKWWCNKTSSPMNYNSSDRAIRIRINSTADTTLGLLKEDYIQYYIGYQAGYLEVNLTNPDTSYTTDVIQNYTFSVNATIACKGGPCGEVTGIARYNFTSEIPDTTINISFGDRPFFIQETPANALKSCGTMYKGQTCQLSWNVNATDNVDTYWKIGVLFNSSYPEIQENHTDNATISILSCTVDIDFALPSINFGLLDPSTGPHNTTGNPNNEYNITVKKGSCNTDLYIKGTDIENKTLNSFIGVGNVTWSNTSDDYSTSFNLTTTNELIRQKVSQNTNVTTWYWINVPPIYTGYYNGTITITGVKNENP